MSDERRRDDALGLLERDPSVDTWWCLPPCPLPFFDGAEVTLVIDDEGADWPLDAGFGQAVPALLALAAARRDMRTSAAVYAYYAKWLAAGFTEPLPIHAPEDVWNHVHAPAEVLFCRDAEGVYALISCSCDWEPEHGLQLVLRDGHRLTRVSTYDGHPNGPDAADLALPSAN